MSGDLGPGGPHKPTRHPPAAEPASHAAWGQRRERRLAESIAEGLPTVLAAYVCGSRPPPSGACRSGTCANGSNTRQGGNEVGVEAILRRLGRLREEVAHLRALAALPEAEFFGRFENVAAAERCLQVAIQACLDMANHLLALLGEPAPPDYGGLFTGLAVAGVLEPNFAEQLRRMAGFRNILVHEYLRVRQDLLREFIVDRVDDLVRFGDIVLRSLPESPQQGAAAPPGDPAGPRSQ